MSVRSFRLTAPVPLEVRTRRGTLKVVEGQRENFPRLRATGMEIVVVESVKEVLVALKAWNIPVRGCSI
jgi:hypothetical protein